jgi:transposase
MEGSGAALPIADGHHVWLWLRRLYGLLELPGCGPLTAAALVGGKAGVERFRSVAAFGRCTGLHESRSDAQRCRGVPPDADRRAPSSALAAAA